MPRYSYRSKSSHSRDSLHRREILSILRTKKRGPRTGKKTQKRNGNIKIKYTKLTVSLDIYCQLKKEKRFGYGLTIILETEGPTNRKTQPALALNEPDWQVM
jgi:hypothetical protein